MATVNLSFNRKGEDFGPDFPPDIKRYKPLTNPIMGETESFGTKEEPINYAMS